MSKCIMVSIHPFSSAYPYKGGGLELFPATIGREVGCTDAQMHRSDRETDEHSH